MSTSGKNVKYGPRPRAAGPLIQIRNRRPELEPVVAVAVHRRLAAHPVQVDRHPDVRPEVIPDSDPDVPDVVGTLWDVDEPRLVSVRQARCPPPHGAVDGPVDPLHQLSRDAGLQVIRLRDVV